jgi:hypothetical protein
LNGKDDYIIAQIADLCNFEVAGKKESYFGGLLQNHYVFTASKE